jgi:hypothetical protein
MTEHQPPKSTLVDLIDKSVGSAASAPQRMTMLRAKPDNETVPKRMTMLRRPA